MSSSHTSRITHHALFLALLYLPSCASHEKKKTVDYSSLSMEQRIVKQIKDPYSVKSPFQKEVYNASQNVKTSKFKATEFHSKKKFFGSKEKFKTAEFAQSDKASKTGEKTFSGADEKSKMGESTFKTKEDPFGEKTSSAASKTSPLGNDIYTPRTNAMTRLDAAKVKRPLVEETPTSYSEDQVKTLLNKQ